jgi:lipopolysaccharide export system protein LptA
MRRLFGLLAGGRLTAVLLLVGVWGGAPVVHGQATGDTTAVDTLGAEAVAPPPAPLDSVDASDAAAPDTTEPGKAIVRADSLSALVQNGERVQELFDNVRVRQDTTRLRSNYGLRYLNRDELLFTGDVVIYERGDTLRADTVRYNKRTKVGHARSNVRLTDGEVLVRAPRATYYTEEKRSVFPDSVTMVDSSRVLRAQEGTYWSNEERAAFSGEVQLTDPETYLESDSLTYFREQERSIATGRVFIRRVETEAGDTTATTYLFGEWADNQEKNRYSRVEEQALLVRVRMDSTGAPDDTLAVRAHQLEATRTDTHRRLVAVDSVRIWQADLAAVADSVVYDRVIDAGPPDTAATPSPLPSDTTTGPVADVATEGGTRLDSLVAQVKPIPLRDAGPPPDPAPPADPARPPPDTARQATAPDTSDAPTARVRAQRRRPVPSDSARADTTDASSPRRGTPWGRPTVQTDEQLPLEETRLFQSPITWFERSQVWGDSIRVRAHNRSLDTVYVHGAAFAAQEDTTVDRIRQLKGKTITAFFRRDSLRKIIARPNGRAIYFSSAADGSLNGATRASADVVTLRFARGDVDRITFGGGVQGHAYHKKEYIPDPFRLKGFQWTPERRPTRARLLREERVREQLNLGPLPAPQRQRRPPVAGMSADSAAASPAGPSGTDASEGTNPAPKSRWEQLREEGRPARPDSVAPPPDSLRADERPRRPPATSDTSQSSPPEP